MTNLLKDQRGEGESFVIILGIWLFVFGLLLYILVASVLPFKNQILNALYPKPASLASTDKNASESGGLNGNMLESENMTFISGLVKVVIDKEASGGKAIILLGNTSVEGKITTKAPTTKVIVRTRLDICSTSPQISLRVDNKRFNIDKSSLKWSDFSTQLELPAGNHPVSISVNNLPKQGCNGFLNIDRILLQ